MDVCGKKKLFKCQKETRRMRIWRLQTVRGGCVLPAATWTQISGVAHFTFPFRAHKSWRARRAEGQKAPFWERKRTEVLLLGVGWCVYADVCCADGVITLWWLPTECSPQCEKVFLLRSARLWLPEILGTGLGVEFLLSRSSTLSFSPSLSPFFSCLFAEALPL